MLPDIHRRSPRSSLFSSSRNPRGNGFDFRAGDEQKTSTSKKILYALIGLVVVIIFIFFYMSSSTKTEPPNSPGHETEHDRGNDPSVPWNGYDPGRYHHEHPDSVHEDASSNAPKINHPEQATGSNRVFVVHAPRSRYHGCGQRGLLGVCQDAE